MRGSRILTSLFIGLFGLAVQSNALITSNPLCNCDDTCCHIDDSTEVDFTGKTIVQITYPDVSYTGNYTVVNHQYHNGTHAVNETLPFQYVFKYNNGFKTNFDRNVMIFTDTEETVLNCSDAFLFYGDPESDYYTKIEMVTVSQDGSTYCTLDINGKLSRDELADDSDVYFAFNKLVDERQSFNIMYDLDNSGVILPEEDIIPYPYIIQSGSVSATDINNSTEFYIDVQLNVSNIDTTQAGIDESCLSIDELFKNGNAYWEVPGGTNCNVTLIHATGDGDAVTAGRTYNIKLSQYEYETCSLSSPRESGGNLYFDFRLVLPVEHTDTNEATDDEAACNYFSSPLNVQNVTVVMKQEVTDELTSEYVTQFEPAVTSIEPVKCTNYDLYPTPHVKLKMSINASFPTANSVDYNTVGQTYFGESWESNVLHWDDNGAGTTPTYDCTTYTDPAGDGTGPGLDGDDYTECEFKFITSVCEPVYTTTDGECALERNTTRFVRDFTIEQTIVGGQTATYAADDINSGVDNTEWDISYCQAEGEREVIQVNDLFETDLTLRNYYYNISVDWSNTSLLTLKDDMILRYRVGETADTPFSFTNDLSLILKTVVLTLRNPLTDEDISSYTLTSADKEAFMGFSWTPYRRDPRFCKWYDSAGGNDKCKDFFIDGVRSNSYHDATWISDVMPKECQEESTLAGEEDDNNADFFLFTPREWFRGDTQGYVEMKVKVTAIVHKCNDNRRMLAEANEVRQRLGQRQLQVSPGGNNVLYVSDEIVVTFVVDDDGNEHVQVAKPAGKTWLEENMTLVIVLSVIGGVIVLGLLFLWIQRRHERGGHIAVPTIISGARPDF
jgi:hypothetical protein